MRFTTASTMAEIDRAAVDHWGLTESALMENAGQLTARHARRRFLDRAGARVGILCGTGNNGADGLVVARWLHQWNYDVTAYLVGDRSEYEGLPAQQLQSVDVRDGLEVLDGSEWSISTLGHGTDLWVDALLGTGLQGDPRSPYDEVIDFLNGQSSPVVAVDVPSGLGGDDNRPYDPCVQAELTVTYGLPKLGLLLEPGYAFAGRVIAQEIGFPPDLYEEHAEEYHLVSPAECSETLPGRYPTAHKGSAGRLAVLAGSEQYTGAPFLTGNAAARTGAGLTGLLGPEGLERLTGPGERDLIFPYDREEILDADRSDEVEEFLDRQNAFVVGPGLGQSEKLTDDLVEFLRDREQPVVLDADGLNNVRDNPEVLADCEELILTPHPGEASRLLDEPIDRITAEPVEAIQKLVRLTKQTVVLKTSRPLVGYPDGGLSVNVTGTAALSKGGSGDVLSGLIGGLLAQGVPVPAACCMALYVQGAAGRRASEELDTISVRSEDLIDRIPRVFEALENGKTPDWFPVKTESQHNEVLRWNPYRT